MNVYVYKSNISKPRNTYLQCCIHSQVEFSVSLTYGKKFQTDLPAFLCISCEIMTKKQFLPKITNHTAATQSAGMQK